MSILVKGMEMPKSCDDCRLNNGISCYAVPEYTEDCVVGKTDDRPNWCPLVEIPPHGRLIDADALDDAFTDLRWENGDYKSGALLHWGDRPNWCLKGSEIESLINAAPTIIEAEEGE